MDINQFQLWPSRLSELILDTRILRDVVWRCVDRNEILTWSGFCRQWTQAAQGMIEGPKRRARPPSEEDEDDDDDLSERPKGNRKDPVSYKGWFLFLEISAVFYSAEISQFTVST